MAKFTVSAIVLAGITALSGTAIACPSHVGPSYIGERSANPEHETYGYVVRTESKRLLGYAGPARTFGAVTGDFEKDTVAYRPLFTGPKASLFVIIDERE